MKLTNLLASASLCLALLAPITAAHALDWEVVDTKDGVTTSKADVPDSKLVAFKGETIMDEPMGRVMWVLLDNEHRTEWVGRLYTNHVIEQTTEYDYVIYQAFDLPALFASRDYVYHGVATRDEATGVVTLSMNSVEHPDAPETVGIRANLINSRYVLTPVEDGKKTKVEVEILTDPMGWMPIWLVNMIQADWPVDTLNGIKGQFSKAHMGTRKLPGEAEAEAKAAEEAAAAEAKAAEEAAAAEAAAAEPCPEGEECPEVEAPAEGEEAPAEEAAEPAAEEAPAGE